MTNSMWSPSTTRRWHTSYTAKKFTTKISILNQRNMAQKPNLSVTSNLVKKLKRIRMILVLQIQVQVKVRNKVPSS